MHRRSIVLTFAFLSVSCTPTPKGLATPTPTIVTVRGTVTATNGGGPLTGLRVASEEVSATTDANGAFALPLAVNKDHRVDITGDGIIPRTVWSRGATATLDAIRLDAALGLDGGPVVTQSLRRWIQSPRLYVRRRGESASRLTEVMIP